MTDLVPPVSPPAVSPPPVSPEYRRVQDALARGWNTWDTRSVLTQVLLPHGLGIRLGLKEHYRGTSLCATQIGRPEPGSEVVTLGPHAIDGSFTSVTVAWEGVEVHVQSAHVGDDLVVLVEPIRNQARPAVLFAAVAFLWGRPGEVHDDGTALVAHAPGMPAIPVFATHPRVDDPFLDVDGPRLAMELHGPVGLSTGVPRSASEISRLVAAARDRTAQGLAGFAEPVHAEIVREAVAWNTLYEPAGERVVTTVSRLWNVQKRGGFAMFCWDAFFGALLAGVHSADLAHANALEMLREIVPDGFVPNVAQGTGRKTYDGSQPPVGALVCRELHRVFGQDWFLRDAFPMLLSWNRWWWRTRRRDDLLCAGSTRFTPEFPSPQDIPRILQHFGATCESGLDGHPVFSDVEFDESIGMLKAYDIGLSAEYAADCEALADIADVLGEADVAAEVRSRGALVSAAIRARLWDEGSGIYRSHRPEDGNPTAYLAPTSFYPMYAGIATPEQSASMVARYLDDPDQFGGRWMLPSFPRGEHHDPLNPYWRDRAWPPMNFLVYLGLLRAGEDTARERLVGESAAMVLQEWTERRHIHENYSSLTGAGCDVDNSQPYLTWGALLSLITLVEDGSVGYFVPWRR